MNPCPQPGMFHDNPDTEGNIRLVGIPGEVDRPVRPPLPPGHYIQAGTTLKMKISIKHPLVPSQNVPRLLPEPQQVGLIAKIPLVVFVLIFYHYCFGLFLASFHFQCLTVSVLFHHVFHFCKNYKLMFLNFFLSNTNL